MKPPRSSTTIQNFILNSTGERKEENFFTRILGANRTQTQLQTQTDKELSITAAGGAQSKQALI